jgi:hypothetical protein
MQAGQRYGVWLRGMCRQACQLGERYQWGRFRVRGGIQVWRGTGQTIACMLPCVLSPFRRFKTPNDGL